MKKITCSLNVITQGFGVHFFVLALFLMLSSLKSANAQILLTEDFNTMPPAGWTLTGSPTGIPPWQVLSSSSVTFTNSGGAPPIGDFHWNPSFSNYDAQLVSPIINGTANTSITLAYNMALDNFGGSLNFWEVQYKTTVSGTWTTLETFDNSGSNLDIVRTGQVLTGMGGNNFQIRIRVYSPSGTNYDINDWYWDHFVVTGIGGGCPSTPVISAVGAPTTICSGSSSTLTASCSVNCTGITYSWAPATGLSATTGGSVTASPLSTTIYTVTGTNSAACTATATVMVTLSAPISFTANATPSLICSGSSSQLTATNPFIGYSTSSIAYSPLSCPVNAGPTGNDNIMQVPIGFNFNFFGNTYSQLAISTNGNIQLGDGTGSTNNPFYTNAWTDIPIPNTGTPNNMIALCWDDWLISAGELTYGISGVAPNRKFIVCYNTTGRGSGSADAINGQIVLSEGSNTVDLIITNKAIQASNTATEGIENADGTSGIAIPGRNNSAWNTTNDAIRIAPTLYNYSWLPATTPPTGASVSTGSLSGSTTYTVTATNAIGCSATATVSVTVNQVTANCSGTNVSCFGGSTGSASVTASGGTPGYSYLWSTTAVTSSISGLTAGTYCVTITDQLGCTATCCYTVTQPSALTANCSGTPASCFGVSNGTASVTASGGTPGYTYLWSTTAVTSSIGGLSAGTYTVTVTDANGCTGTCTSVVSQPTLVTANCSGLPVSCFGGNNGSASVAASGGTPGYTYLWSTTAVTSIINGLSAGTYCVTITDAHGCTATCCYTVTQPAVLAATATSTNASCPLCPDGTVSISSVTGGTPPYSYFPSNPRTNLLPGNYCITVTDANGCTTSACATVGAAGCTMTVNMTLNHNVSCFGGNNGSVTASPSGFVIGPWSYQWDNGSVSATVNNLNAGNHTVIVTDNGTGCVAQGNITISQPPLLTANCGGTNASCFGGSNGSASVTAGGGTPGYTYLWSTTAVTSSIGGLTAGTYTVTVTDANGCTATCASVVSQPSALVANCSSTPVSGCFGGSNGTASVTASGGTPGYTYLWSTTAITSSIGSLTAGTYTVTVTDAHGCTSTCVATITQPSPVAINATVSNVHCKGAKDGSISVSGSGGTPGYSYHWNNGSTSSSRTGLAPGTYCVTVTDANGCISNGSLQCQNYAPIATEYMLADQTTYLAQVFTSTLSSANVQVTLELASCKGNGLAGAQLDIVTVSAGAPQWNNSIGTAIVPEPQIYGMPGCVAGTFGPSNFSLNGVNLVSGTQYALVLKCAPGADPGAAIAWRRSSMPTDPPNPYTSGNLWTYDNTMPPPFNEMENTTLDLQFNICAIVPSISCWTITQPATSLVLNTSKTNVRCGGKCTGSATLAPTGGCTPYTYLWNTGSVAATIGNLCAGTYTCTVTDGCGCVKTATIVITQNVPLVVVVIQTGPTQATASVSGGCATYTYYWNTNPPQSTATAAGLIPGNTYKVRVTDCRGCSQTTVITIQLPKGASVGGVSSGLTVTAFPNPTTGKLTMDFNDGAGSYKYTVKLSDVTGRELFVKSDVKEPGSRTVDYDFGTLPKGLYSLSIQTEKANQLIKIVLQ